MIIPQNETEVKHMKKIFVSVCKIVVDLLVIFGFIVLMVHVIGK